MNRIEIALGADAPNFTADAIIDGEVNKNVMFAPRENGFKLLFFYTGDFKDVNSELIERLNTFHDCKVYGVSTDSIDVHVAWLKSMNIFKNHITLFSDENRRISAMYASLSAKGPCIPSMYIIDNLGKLRFIQYTDAKMVLGYLNTVLHSFKN